eukprot:CAMPEP_0180798460 /NCGR_PEP_ID=MMETSP1038_2-20121128/57972_1 /TAXON_ID=632150 /ORGANISM="Azadinium spinosum, Strain 3D9" /LENGTH=54 /DNA_ID=CAMNT_0022837903 /DNA_START=131 /DNA_END=291 /DNA_ORIENTATION=-
MAKRLQREPTTERKARKLALKPGSPSACEVLKKNMGPLSAGTVATRRNMKAAGL